MRHAWMAGLCVSLALGFGSGCGGGGGDTPDGGEGGQDGGGGQVDGGTRFEGNPQAIAVQSGKLIVAGSRDGRGADFFVARYGTSGELDPAFGQGGFTTLDFDGGTGGFLSQNADAVYALAVGDDGSIVAVGGARGPAIAAGGYAVAKYTADGQLDTGFSLDGLSVTQIPASGGGFVTAAFYAVALQPDGKILAGGSVYRGTTAGNDYLLVRYNADGTVDTAFSNPPGGGGVLQGFGGTAEHVRGIFLQGTKVVAAGGGRFLAVRFNEDGSLDTSFGDMGIARHGTQGEAFAVAARPDGRLVLAGTADVSLPDGGTEVGLKVVQYTADGQLDTAFGSGGVVEDPVLTYVKGVVVEPNGNVAVYGTESSRPAIVRLLPDGRVDGSFGTNGVMRVEGYKLPLLQNVYAGNQAVWLDGRLWFTDTGQGEGELAVVKGEGVIVDSVALP